jgi:hypothetical protein
MPKISRRKAKIVRIGPKPKKPQYLVDTPQYADLIAEGHKLIGKCKFLVARSEFLYQQALSLNVHAQELVRDASVSGSEVSAMTAKLDALISQGAKRAKRARARRRKSRHK